MLRSKRGLLSLCVLALGLMTFVSSAQAAEWLILKTETEVKTATELPAEVVSELENNMVTLLATIAHIPFSALCSSGTLIGTKLEGGGKLTTGGKVTFTGCTVPTPSGCTVKSPGAAVGTVESNKGKGKLESGGEVKVEPETGETFASLIFEGATCTLPTEVSDPIKGVLWLKDCENMSTLHLQKHLWTEDTSHGMTLYIGTNTLEHQILLDGSFWMKLAGVHTGKLWGATLP